MFTVWSHALFNVNAYLNTSDQKCLLTSVDTKIILINKLK